MYITADAYTRDELVEMEIWMLAALEFRIPTPTAAHFLERVGRVGRCDARQRYLAQSLFELTLTHYSMCGHWPSHLACSAVIISNCSSVARMPSSRQVQSLSQDGYGNVYMGQTETPRREEWSVSSFSRCGVPLHSVCEGPPFPYVSHRRIRRSNLPAG